MKCPYCSEEGSKVIDSRWAEDTNTIRRRRKCVKCGQRFTSYERIEEGPIYVIKRDGRREEFCRSKVFDGLRKACEKLPIPADTVDKVTDRIVYDIREKYGREVKASDIGECLLSELRVLDPVAYVRFVSVYKHFRDIEEFFDLLRDLMEEKSTRRLILRK